MAPTISAPDGSRPVTARWPTSSVVLAFEALSVVSVIAAGVWFVAAGWGEFSNAAAIAAFVVVGLAGAILTLPLSRSGRHWLAALAAAVAIVTPTGFAYLPNLMMAAVGAIEARLAITGRRSDETSDQRHLSVR